MQCSPSNKATTTLNSGTTLFVNPTSFPYKIDAAATAAEKRVTVSTGPSTVGMTESE
jgi:hypothetical protein